MEFLTVAGGLVGATAFTWLGVGGFRAWALRRRLLDVPNHRSSHVRPVPRGGGLAMVLVTLLGWLALQGVLLEASWRAAAAYAFGAAAVAAISWIDDLYSISYRSRLAVHLLGAVVAAAAIGAWHAVDLPWGYRLHLGHFGAVLTVLWIMGLTNAYNFMDGSDGMAGAQGVVAGVGWVCLGLLSGSPMVAGLALLLAGASLGFLLHNWPPARVFMGDVGSAFLGYSFAVLPLFGLREDGPLAGAGPIISVLPVWPFVFDAALTFLRRLRRGENVFAAHRSHLYQRLIIAGYSHRSVLFLYGAMATLGAAAGVFWLQRPAAALCCSAVLFPSLGWMLCRFVVAQERRAREAVPAPQIMPAPMPRRRAA